MPIAPFLLIYTPGGKPLAGPFPVIDPEEEGLCGSEVQEFSHRVFTIRKDYFYTLLYGVDFIRRHEPMTVVKEIDKTSVPLLECLKNGTFLPKAELRWLHYNPDKRKTEEYFRMTLEHVRLHRIRTILPDCKVQEFERYGHLEELQFMYQKITWLYIKGHLLHTDIWNGGFFAEEDEKDFSGKKSDGDDEDAAALPLEEKLSLKFTSGIFEEPKNGFEFDKPARVTFTYESNRRPGQNENKVYAKLYAVFNNKTEDLHQINEGRLVAENSWSTEFRLRRPEGCGKDAGKPVEYYAEVENQAAGGSFKGESISVPKKQDAELVIELAINPEDPQFEKYEFKLMSADGGSAYSKTLTVADDAEKGDETLTLIFTDLDSSLNYCLELIIDGTPTGEHIFADCPYLELEKQYGN